MKYSKSTITYIVWGLFDLIFLIWYSYHSIRRGKIIFYDDIVSVINNAIYHGGIDVAIYSACSVLLTLSLIFSSFLLLFRMKFSILICFIQTPFRLVLFAPSISLITILSVLSAVDIVLVIIIMFVSEALKLFSLWKFQNFESKNKQSRN